MGFLDHLFKPKPSEEKMGEEKKGGAGAAGGNGKIAGTAPDPGEFLHPKRIGLGGGVVYSPVRHERAAEKNPPAPEERREIVIVLGDVLSRIPTQLLHMGMHDAKRELRFSVDELSADIARGRAAVPLSKIAALCPEVFVRRIEPADDFEIRLPLQKLVEQVSLLSGRQTMPPARAEAARAKDSPPDEPKPAPSFGEEEIHLSLAVILRGCPPEIVVGKLPPVDPDVRITLPYAPIERQFANERVEVSSARFVSVLPPELRAHFAPREGVKVPLPIEEILKNLPGAADLAPEVAASSEAADARMALAEFLSQAEDQSLAPAPAGEPVSEAVGEPAEGPPGAEEVAAQTPRETQEEPEPAAESIPLAPVEPVLPARHVFAPPPPVLVGVPDVPSKNVVAHSERGMAPSEKSGVAEEVPPPAPVQPVVRLHPPPAVRPVLVQPPPILASSPAPEPGHPAQPVLPSDPPPDAEVKPAPFPLEALQTLFMTDEALDIAAVARLTVALPGVRACALGRRGEKATAGRLPEGFTFAELAAVAERLSGAADNGAALPVGTLQSFTLHGDQAAISVFARPGMRLAVMHGTLPPGVRERLSTVADELACP